MKTLFILVGLVTLVSVATARSRFQDSWIRTPVVSEPENVNNRRADILEKIRRYLRDDSPAVIARAQFLFYELDVNEDKKVAQDDFDNLAAFIIATEGLNADAAAKTKRDFTTLFNGFFLGVSDSPDHFSDYVKTASKVNQPFICWNNAVCKFFFGFVDGDNNGLLTQKEYENIYTAFTGNATLAQASWKTLNAEDFDLAEYTACGIDFYTNDDPDDDCRNIFGPFSV